MTKKYNYFFSYNCLTDGPDGLMNRFGCCFIETEEVVSVDTIQDFVNEIENHLIEEMKQSGSEDVLVENSVIIISFQLI